MSCAKSNSARDTEWGVLAGEFYFFVVFLYDDEPLRRFGCGDGRDGSSDYHGADLHHRIIMVQFHVVPRRDSRPQIAIATTFPNKFFSQDSCRASWTA